MRWPHPDSQPPIFLASCLHFHFPAQAVLDAHVYIVKRAAANIQQELERAVTFCALTDSDDAYMGLEMVAGDWQHGKDFEIPVRLSLLIHVHVRLLRTLPYALTENTSYVTSAAQLRSIQLLELLSAHDAASLFAKCCVVEIPRDHGIVLDTAEASD